MSIYTPRRKPRAKRPRTSWESRLEHGPVIRKKPTAYEQSCSATEQLDKEARAAEREVVRQAKEDARRQREKEAADADAARYAAEEERKWRAKSPSERSIIDHCSRYSYAPDTLLYFIDTDGNIALYDPVSDRVS